MSLAARSLVPVTLELGGNDPGLVLDDADLGEEAIRRMVIGAFLSAGQVCMALKRLYVYRSRFDELVEALTGFLDRAVIGDGLSPEVTMGPLNNEAQFRKVRAMIDQAAAAGTELRPLGIVRDEAEYAHGYFVRPTLAIEPDPSLDLVAEEQFGPVLPILSFEDENEAIEWANDSRFALCSSVWTADRKRALSVARRLEAGYTYFNNHGPLGQDSRAPFGGFKESGIGRNLGYDGVLSLLGAQSMSGDTGWLL